MLINKFRELFRKNIGTDLLIILTAAAVPVLFAHLNSEKPQNRYIHIENFRYGKNPSEIMVNHGDTLHLTFSSEDTGHSFFLEEFDIDVKVNPGNGKVMVFKASDPGHPPKIKDTVVVVAQHSGIYNYFVSKSHYRCHVWCGPMHAFEHGNLIILPNTLLNLGLGMLAGFLLVAFRRAGKFDISSLESKSKSVDLFKRFPSAKKLVEKNWFQPAMMFLAAIFLYVVLLTTLFGTQMSGRNLGIMLVWVVWLFLLVSILTPLGGRIWCLVCPLPMLGEFAQRKAVTYVNDEKTDGYWNKLSGLKKTWPEKLRNSWPRLTFFMVTGTLSTTFVAEPKYTGLAILLLVVMSTGMALIWKFRSFCQFLCPINAFISLYSKMGKLAVRKSDDVVCDKCTPEFCEFGSPNGWACPYELSIKTLDSNFECGMCTECMRSCMYENVTFKWRKFGSEYKITDISTAWTAIAMLVLGIAYCIVYLGHWSVVRDYVNILDKANYGLFGIYTVVLWSAALLIAPMLFYAVTYISKRLAGLKQKTMKLMIDSSGALLPIGLFVWIAFIIQMLFTNVTFIAQSLSDPFGWGWNLLGFAGTPWIQFMPRLVPFIQVIAILAGFYYSAKNLTKIWAGLTGDVSTARLGMIPTLLLLAAVSASMIWFFAG